MSKSESVVPFVISCDTKTVKAEPLKRQQWANNREFFLVCLGYCVGLANLWRFPYLCYKNGGGSFLIPYSLVAIFVGMPSYFLEVAIGQFMRGSINAYNLVPIMRGIGFGSTMIAFYDAVYYIMPMVWSMMYFIHSFSFGGDLPWSKCDNWWNTKSCISYEELIMRNESSVTTNASNYVLAVEEFWRNYITRQSSGVEDVGTISNYPLMLCFLVSWIICYLCLFKGTKSTGKVAHFTATFPYVIITIFVIRSCTLTGSGEGIKYYLFPNITRLADISVWIQAGSQVVYSYGVGISVLTAFGSYNDFHVDCFKYCAILTSICSLTSLYFGFAVFGLLGHLSYLTGKTVADVVSSGPGLVFQTFPTMISMMPYSQLWGILFFFMMLTVVVDSEFTCSEAILCGLYDWFPQLNQGKNRREFVTLGLFVFMALLGIPFTFGGGLYYFEIINNYAVAGYVLFPLVLFEIVSFSYLYGINKLYDDIKLMIGYYPHMFLKISLKFVTPAISLTIIIFTFMNYQPLTMGEYTYPIGVNVIGWMLVTSSLIMVPIFFVKTLVAAPGSTLTQKWKNATMPRYPSHLIKMGYPTHKTKCDISVL